VPSTQEATTAQMFIFLVQAPMVVILEVAALQENGQRWTL
jgi:hypothetical protein